MEKKISDYIEKRKDSIDALMERYMPRHVSEESVNEIFGKPRHAYDVSSIQKTLSDPVWNFLDRGGKRWRPMLFLLIMEALGKTPDDFSEFAIIPEIIHNGTIIVDDIEDDSELRRGKPALHNIYGTDIAINAGNMLYFLPLLPLLRSGVGEEKKCVAFRVYAEEMINLHLGQSMDIFWHKGKAKTITEEQYLQMCALKTGTLARMAARLAVVLSDGDKKTEEALGHMAETIGIAFQIQDDILDITSHDKRFGKSWGNDIKEGKRSFMVVHVLSCGTKKDRQHLMAILDSHTEKRKEIEEAIAILQKYDAIAYAQNFARSLVASAWKGAERLLDEGEAKQTLKSFVGYLVEREF